MSATDQAMRDTSDILHLLLEKYGPTLNLSELAEVLKLEPSTVSNQISAGKCPIPTYKQGQGRRSNRVAYIQDVAEYLESCRLKAHQQFAEEQTKLAS